jgi:hypothetical protein
VDKIRALTKLYYLICASFVVKTIQKQSSIVIVRINVKSTIHINSDLEFLLELLGVEVRVQIALILEKTLMLNNQVILI